MDLIEPIREEGICTVVRDFNIPGGELRYYENFLSPELADFYLETFLLMPFQQGEVRGGMEKRQSCFYSDLRNPDGTLRIYNYAGKQNAPLEFTDELRTLKESTERALGLQFNSCLANLYANGKNVIGYHSDSESSIIPTSTIASISLGAERWFDVRAKDDAPDPNINLRIRMKHGSMITMGGQMQRFYKHQVPQEAKIKDPRVNLTFRQAR